MRVVGNDMIAAKKSSTKSSGKCNTEMFDDVPVLQRKWQAALRPGLGARGVENQVRIVGRGEAGKNARIAVGASE